MVSLALLLFGGLLFGWFGLLLGQIGIYASVALSVYSCIAYLYKYKNVFHDDNQEVG